MRKLRWPLTILFLLIIGITPFMREEPVDEFAALKPYIVEDSTVFWGSDSIEAMSGSVPGTSSPPPEMHRTISLRSDSGRVAEKTFEKQIAPKHGWSVFPSSYGSSWYRAMRATRGTGKYQAAISMYQDFVYKELPHGWDRVPGTYMITVKIPLKPWEVWRRRIKMIGRDAFH